MFPPFGSTVGFYPAFVGSLVTVLSFPIIIVELFEVFLKVPILKTSGLEPVVVFVVLPESVVGST